MATIKSIQHLITIALVPLAMTACGDQDRLSESHRDTRLITFGTSVQVETKAVISGRVIPAGDRVGIYALEADATPVWKASGNLMDNIGAVSNEAGGLDYSPLKAYVDQKVYNFYAYYPYTSVAATTGGNGIVAPADGTAPKLRASLEKTSGAQTDYLYATPILGYQWEVDQPGITQVLRFKHALMQIRFRFSYEAIDNTISIVRIEVKDKDKGTMDITDGQWLVDDGEAATFTFFQSTTAVKPIAVKAGESHVFTEQLMLFPKTGTEMAANETLQFLLTLKDNAGNEEQITVTPKEPANGLAAGNSYLYTLIYGSTGYEISLSATLEDWQEIDGGNLPLIPDSK